MDLKVDKFCIKDESTLKDVMLRMTINKLGVLFVVVQEGVLLGFIIDGDIIRAILRGAVMSAPVSKIINVDVKYLEKNDNAGKVREILARYVGILLVPVLDSNKKIKKILSRYP